MADLMGQLTQRNNFAELKPNLVRYLTHSNPNYNAITQQLQHYVMVKVLRNRFFHSNYMGVQLLIQ